MSTLDIKWTHLTEVLNQFADRFIELAKQNLENNGSNASHNLSNSIEKIIEIGEDHFTVSISLEDYWKYIEEGTGPAHLPDARAQYWPKIGPLKEWVSIKPGVPKDPGFAYAVRWKIHEEGTEPQPFFEPAKEEAIRQFSKAIDEAIAKDVDDWLTEIVETGMRNALG